MKRIAIFFGWQLWKRTIRLPIVLLIHNGMRFIAHPDSDVSAAFLYHKNPDARDINFLRDHIGDGTFVDVGANVGSVSLLLADKISGAVLFEPNPIAASRARENILLNRLPFEVHEVALSDQCGTVEFEDIGGASTCNRAVVGFDTSAPTRTVRCATLDSMVFEQSLFTQVGAIKIDVEGHENAVIRGMGRLLREKRPAIVMFEYLQRTKLCDTLTLFRDAGYTVFALTPQGPSEIRESARPLQNLFACPEELFGTL